MMRFRVMHQRLLEQIEAGQLNLRKLPRPQWPHDALKDSGKFRHFYLTGYNAGIISIK